MTRQPSVVRVRNRVSSVSLACASSPQTSTEITWPLPSGRSWIAVSQLGESCVSEASVLGARRSQRAAASSAANAPATLWTSSAPTLPQPLRSSAPVAAAARQLLRRRVTESSVLSQAGRRLPVAAGLLVRYPALLRQQTTVTHSDDAGGGSPGPRCRPPVDQRDVVADRVTTGAPGARACGRSGRSPASVSCRANSSAVDNS